MTDWISVKDRLPDERGSYLAYDDDDIVIAKYDSGAWLDEQWGDELKYVTHWQPLPEAPEEE